MGDGERDCGRGDWEWEQWAGCKVNKIKKSPLWAGRHASVGEESGHTLSESFGHDHLGEK